MNRQKISAAEIIEKNRNRNPEIGEISEGEFHPGGDRRAARTDANNRGIANLLRHARPITPEIAQKMKNIFHDIFEETEKVMNCILEIQNNFGEPQIADPIAEQKTKRQEIFLRAKKTKNTDENSRDIRENGQILFAKLRTAVLTAPETDSPELRQKRTTKLQNSHQKCQQIFQKIQEIRDFHQSTDFGKKRKELHGELRDDDTKFRDFHAMLRARRKKNLLMLTLLDPQITDPETPAKIAATIDALAQLDNVLRTTIFPENFKTEELPKITAEIDQNAQEIIENPQKWIQNYQEHAAWIFEAGEKIPSFLRRSGDEKSKKTAEILAETLGKINIQK